MHAAEERAAAMELRKALGAEDIMARRQENLMRRLGPRIQDDTAALQEDLDLWGNPERAAELRERQARRMADTKRLGWDSFAVPDPRPERFSQDIYKAQVEAGKTKLPRSRRKAYIRALAAPILSRYGLDFASEQMVGMSHAVTLSGATGGAAPAEGVEGAPGAEGIAGGVVMPRPDAAGYVYELIAAAAPDEMTPEEAMEKYVELAHDDLDNPNRAFDEDTADFAFDLLVTAGRRQDTPEERTDFIGRLQRTKAELTTKTGFRAWLRGLPTEMQTDAQGQPITSPEQLPTEELRALGEFAVQNPGLSPYQIQKQFGEMKENARADIIGAAMADATLGLGDLSEIVAEADKKGRTLGQVFRERAIEGVRKSLGAAGLDEKLSPKELRDVTTQAGKLQTEYNQQRGIEDKLVRTQLAQMNATIRAAEADRKRAEAETSDIKISSLLSNRNGLLDDKRSILGKLKDKWVKYDAVTAELKKATGRMVPLPASEREALVRQYNDITDKINQIDGELEAKKWRTTPDTTGHLPLRRHGSWGKDFGNLQPAYRSLARKWRKEGVGDGEIAWRLEQEGVEW